MSEHRHPGDRSAACTACLRRAWLLSRVSVPLDYRAGDRPRLRELLALEDQALLQALAGRRREQLGSDHRAFDSTALEPSAGVETVCRHCDDYPSALRGDRVAPPLLHVSGGRGRLVELAAAPMVAIAGSRRGSDYGIEMARSLGRGLAASGVTVAAVLTDGIAAAALRGVLDARGAAIMVLGDGLGIAPAARRRVLYRRALSMGCAVSELPHDCRGRRWGAVAAERTVARLARLLVVVEARDQPEDMGMAQDVEALGRRVAAVPGRVTSPLSAGTHGLLVRGASLVRGPGDVLDLLDPPQGVGEARAAHVAGPTHAGLEPRLARILEQVGIGRDTPDQLAAAERYPADVLPALSELELLGLLVRGDGGRYVPRPFV
jgi:DNA processing protein